MNHVLRGKRKKEGGKKKTPKTKKEGLRELRVSVFLDVGYLFVVGWSVFSLVCRVSFLCPAFLLALHYGKTRP